MKKKIVCFPKVKLSRLIWSNIRKAQYLNELSDEQLAKALNVSIRTLNNYDNDPSRISFKNVEEFIDNTETPFEQLIIV